MPGRRRYTLARFDRLYLLSDLLRRSDRLTVPELARRLSVSERTIARDLAFLRDHDVPVEGQRGPAGGVRILSADRPVGRGVDLTDDEVAALWLAVWLTATRGGAEAADIGRSAFEKVEAALPADRRVRLRALAERVIVGDAAGRHLAEAAAPPQPGIVAALAQSFALGCRLQISYVDAGGRASERVVEPHALLVQVPLWYLLAVDQGHGEPRTFRLDRVQTAAAQLESRFVTLDPWGLFPELGEMGAKRR